MTESTAANDESGDDANSETNDDANNETNEEGNGETNDDANNETDEDANSEANEDADSKTNEEGLTEADIAPERAERLDDENRPDQAEVDNTDREFDSEKGMFTDSEGHDDAEEKFAAEGEQGA